MGDSLPPEFIGVDGTGCPRFCWHRAQLPESNGFHRDRKKQEYFWYSEYRFRSHVRKIPYLTRAAADAARLRTTTDKGQRAAVVYRCYFCDMYHVGHRSRPDNPVVLFCHEQTAFREAWADYWQEAAQCWRRAEAEDLAEARQEAAQTAYAGTQMFIRAALAEAPEAFPASPVPPVPPVPPRDPNAPRVKTEAQREAARRQQRAQRARRRERNGTAGQEVAKGDRRRTNLYFASQEQRWLDDGGALRAYD
jgi:hypothetical protein